MKIFRLLCHILIGLSASTAQYVSGAAETDATKISLVALIVQSNLLQGKLIEVDGFVDSSFESSMLYLGKDDLDYAIKENGIRLIIKKEDLAEFRQHNGKCCRVVGRFVNQSNGPNDQSVGVIEVSSISEVHEIRVQYRDSIVKQLGVVEYLIFTEKGNKNELMNQRKDLLKQLKAYK